jgi:hypothetical protein
MPPSEKKARNETFVQKHKLELMFGEGMLFNIP